MGNFSLSIFKDFINFYLASLKKICRFKSDCHHCVKGNIKKQVFANSQIYYPCIGEVFWETHVPENSCMSYSGFWWLPSFSFFQGAASVIIISPASTTEICRHRKSYWDMRYLVSFFSVLLTQNSSWVHTGGYNLSTRYNPWIFQYFLLGCLEKCTKERVLWNSAYEN